MSRVIEAISSKESSGQVNLREIMMFFTGNLICRIASGKDNIKERSEKRKFDKLMIEHQAMQGGILFLIICRCLVGLIRLQE